MPTRPAAVLVASTLAALLTALPARADAACTRDGRELSPLACSALLAAAPVALGFDAPAEGLAGTGFTMAAPPAAPPGFDASRLTVGGGRLGIDTDAGTATGPAEAQRNALGVGVRPGRTLDVTTTLVDVTRGSGRDDQAGLWWGTGQDDAVRLAVVSRRGLLGPATAVRLTLEVAGQTTRTITTANRPALASGPVTLTLHTDPFTRRVRATYAAGSERPRTVGTVAPPSEQFSADAAGIDPAIGTNTFAGVYATAAAGTPRRVGFDAFGVTDVTSPATTGALRFDRVDTGAGVESPTAMAFGPDGRLYVTEVLGRIHALTLDGAHHVTGDQVIDALGTRLTLGLAVDPASTATDVVLWVAHSDPELAGPDGATGLGGAAVDSSAVGRIAVDPAARTATRLPDAITGLPRSQADHSINAIHFGPAGADGRRRLFIAVGSNTNAGAPNATTAYRGEFGVREEQPLSAALLEADVFGPGFDGSCANTADPYGPPPCSVTTYATGFRNPYDFVFHSNGSLYGTDNGAAVAETYPPSPTPPCTGLAQYPRDSPGLQHDALHRIEPGRSYGHPDPHRLPAPECVFEDGRDQGVPAPASYQAAIADLGADRSADGMVEYRSPAFGGRLAGDLLIANYALGDDITRVRLSADGRRVVWRSRLAGGFQDPLPLAEGADGTVYVGEFGAGRLTALVPSPD